MKHTSSKRKSTAILLALALASVTLLATSCDLANVSPADNGVTVTKSEAKNIALTDLGITEEQAVYAVVTPETLKGKEYYNVELDVNGIRYRYRIDAESGEVVKTYVNDEAVETAPAVKDPAAESTADEIGLERAKEIALADAGVTQETVTDYEFEMDYANGAYYYEIDFKANGHKYEYDIAVTNGAIHKKNVDKQTVIEPAPADGTAHIGVEAAKTAALAHAGLTADTVTFEQAKWDREKGVAVYELEFYANGTEYEYTVNAASGDVIHHKTENMQNAQNAQNAANNNGAVDRPAADLSMTDAKAIALAHAGLSEAEVVWKDCELEKEHGLLVYEIDFEANGYEYEYLINAESGDILEADKERD